MKDELLPVTQEDREAAAALAEFTHALAGDEGVKRVQELMLNGGADKMAHVQAFARHRLNTRPAQGHDALVEAELDLVVQWLMDPARTGLHSRDMNIAIAIQERAYRTSLPSPQAEAESDGLVEELRAQLTTKHADLEWILRLFPSGVFSESYTSRNDVISFKLHLREAETLREIANRTALRRNDSEDATDGR